jgi:hypothetical protein
VAGLQPYTVHPNSSWSGPNPDYFLPGTGEIQLIKRAGMDEGIIKRDFERGSVCISATSEQIKRSVYSRFVFGVDFKRKFEGCGSYFNTAHRVFQKTARINRFSRETAERTSRNCRKSCRHVEPTFDKRHLPHQTKEPLAQVGLRAALLLQTCVELHGKTGVEDSRLAVLVHDVLCGIVEEGHNCINVSIKPTGDAL